MERKKRTARELSPEIRKEEVLPLLRKIVRCLEKEYSEDLWHEGHNRSYSFSPQPSTSRGLSRKITELHDKGSDKVEIQPESGVYVSREYLKTDVKKFRLRPSEMVRLMLYLVGAENLTEMTARGSKSKKGIPPRVLKAVKYYVDRNESGCLPEAMYLRMINQQCGTLRASKTEKARDKEKQEDEEKQDEDEDTDE